jgi:hypothetical protein
MRKVLPMTARENPIQVGLSHEEAEMLRSLLRSDHVPAIDELARLRTGTIIAKSAHQPSRADGLVSLELIEQAVTLL